jgi:hypothetical protein
MIMRFESLKSRMKSVTTHRRGNALGAVLLLAVMAIAPRATWASPALDQSNSALPTMNFTSLRAGFTAAQTFTVGFPGTLTGVSVIVDPRGTPTANLTLEVQSTTGGAANGTVLASASVPPFGGSNPMVFFDVSSANLSVSAGSVLAFVLKSNATAGNDYLARAVPSNTYTRGQFTDASGAFASGAGWGAIFKTYVDPGALPGPGDSDQSNLQTPTTNFTAVGTGRTCAQTFTVGASGVLTSINVVVDPRNSPVLDLVMEVQATTGGAANGTVLASASAAPFGGTNPTVTFDFSPYRLAVTQGQVLAFVLRSNAALGTDYLARAVPGNTYPDGQFTDSSGGFASGAGWDAIFETFVRDVTPPAVHALATWPRSVGCWFQIGSRPRLTITADDLNGVCVLRILLSRSGHGGPFTLLHTIDLCPPLAVAESARPVAALDDTLSWDWDVTGPATSTGVLRFEAEDALGNVGAEESDEFDISADVAVGPASASEFALGPIAPNPIRMSGSIEYSLPRAARVRLGVHDLLGREVAVLADGVLGAGRHTARFDAPKLGLNAGVYFVRLTSPAGSRVRRVVVRP